MLFSMSLHAQNTHIFISNTGDNTNDGTKDRPLQSIEAALRHINQHLSESSDSIVINIASPVYRSYSGIRINNQTLKTFDGTLIVQGQSKESTSICGSVVIDDYKKLNRQHPLYRKNPKNGEKIIEISTAKLPINQQKIRLAGFAGSKQSKNYALNEIIFNNEPMSLSRWPNKGYTKFSGVAKKQSGDTTLYGIKFQNQKISEWADEPNILLHGYWYWLWADAYESVSHIAADDNILWLEPPYNNYLFRGDKPFAAVNVIREIDQPGEYAYDYQNKKIYFFPPDEIESLELSVCQTPLIEIENCNNVIIRNLSIKNSAHTGIKIVNSNNVLIDNCAVTSVAREGMIIDGGQHNSVINCEIWNTGRGGIRLNAGSYSTLESGYASVKNCHIHHLSRIDLTYTPGIWVDGVGISISHCTMHNIPSSAIRLNGNDHMVEFNTMYAVVTESDDQGAIDMWGTANYRGNIIRYNHFYNVGPQNNDAIDAAHGRAGVRLDDAISGVLIYGNVFNNSSKGKFGGIQIHGGKENIVWNNIFYDCDKGMSFTPWSFDHWKHYTRKTIDTYLDNQMTYINKYPQLLLYDENMNQNYVLKNIFINCDQLKRGNPKLLIWKDNVETVVPEINQFNIDKIKSVIDTTDLNFTPLPEELMKILKTK